VHVPRCELRDHINCRKNDHWSSYRFYGALQRLKSSMRYIGEIFGAARSSSFSTQSANLGNHTFFTGGIFQDPLMIDGFFSLGQ
jgi:hypothetical protein